MRWEEMSWDKVRRAQMRWSVECEECSVKCGAWRVCSVKCGVWSVECEVWSVKCGVCSGKRAVKCEVWIGKSAVCMWVKCGVWSVDCEGCGVKCEDCQVWSVTWGFKCDMWNTTSVSQSARTHGLGWRTAHASSIDEKGLIYIFKATSAPPRAGTTGKRLHNYGKSPCSMGKSTISTGSCSIANCECHYQSVSHGFFEWSLQEFRVFSGEKSHLPQVALCCNDLPGARFAAGQHDALRDVTWT